MQAKLILENGIVFEGKSFGYLEESVGEVLFNTGMIGYEEVLTDPSYYGQIVTMTYPLIGNYGINLEDIESEGPKVSGFIVREKCDSPSNFRCEMDLQSYLKQNHIIGLEGIDTSALTKTLSIKSWRNHRKIEVWSQRLKSPRKRYRRKQNIHNSTKSRLCSKRFTNKYD